MRAMKDLSIAADHYKLGDDLGGRVEYPAIAVDHTGVPWVFWDRCDREESRVYTCRIENGRQMTPEPVSPLGHVAFESAAAVDSSGNIWVSWAWWHDGEWDIEGRIFDGSIWRSARQLVAERGSDLSPSLAADSEGRVWLVWQAYRGEGLEIHAKYWKHGVESETKVVSLGTACSNYRPAITAGRDGSVWVIWDGWKDKNYEIFASRYTDGSWSPPRNISINPGYDCYRPQCAPDPSGGIWATWNIVTRGETEWGTAAARVTEESVEPVLLPPGLVSKATNFASIALDATDRPWIIWQERQPGRRWNALACVFDGNRWAGPYPVWEQGPEAKQFSPCVARGPGGDLWVAWARKHPMAARIAGGWIGELEQSSFAAEPVRWETRTPLEFGATADSKRSHAIKAEGEEYHLYWGDLHNHSELSDGRQPLDHCFALARDVYALDFVCMADHDANVTEGKWRLTQAISSIMNEPGRFVTLAGYESSYRWARAGAGHRNIVHPGDEGAICHYREGFTLPELLHCVRTNKGIAIPHHIGRWFAPIDWESFDPAVQPIVEICSVHGIFEYFGNPWKPRPEYLPAPAVDQHKTPVEGSFVQDGWARGLRFGVIGSTDSHINYSYGIRRMALAAVYAKDLTREDLFDAFRARRTYGTTGERVFLDFRVNDHIMGEEFTLRRGKSVTVRVTIEAPVVVKRVDIVRDNETVHSRTVNGRQVNFSWKDAEPSSFSTYYYARVVMEEDNYAWSSPVWVDWE
ncbi:MAG: CehA/McbA family metallohydrolase [Candidatus Eisenbacteria sp.]|nr:CehA/McbA family metallohydrolase [Candidatus Eisenbacteria bacterium]